MSVANPSLELVSASDMDPAAELTLARAAVGEPLTVLRVGGERSFRRRLMELGVVPGTAVSVQRVSPLGDPLELAVRGGRVSLRRENAQQIVVRRTAR